MKTCFATWNAVAWTCIAASLCGAGVLCGCAKNNNNLSLFEAHGPIEVGATQFAVTSVTPWSQIQRDLQPNFEMNEEMALQEVMPSSLYSTEQQTNSMQLGLTAGYSMLPTGRKQPSAESTGKTGNSGSGGSSKTGSGKGSYAGNPATSSDNSTPSTDNAEKPASPPLAHGPTIASQQTQANGGPLAMEPQLKYSLATSLLQYVRLTNHYVQDLVNHDQCDAYVVRIQVSLMPLTRTSQYDTYVDIGFFDEAMATTDGGTQSAISSLQVVPLLSTDSLEGVIRSQSTNDLRELALSLQATFNGAGAGIDADKLSQILKQVSGRDVNSLVTMGRVSDNTLRVRLGAQAEPTGQYVMVPRTYTVPVILMVRRSPSSNHQTTIRAVSKTVFINALTGQLLAGRTHLQNVAALPEIRETYNLFKLGLGEADLMKLTEYALLDDVQDFTRLVQSKGPPLSTAEIGRLWLEALSLRATDAVQKLTFSLPKSADPLIPPIGQTAWLFDDGTKTVVSLYGGQTMSRLSLEGILEVISNDGKQMRLYAVDAPAISSDERVIAFAFPSLSAAGIDLPVGNVPGEKVTLCVESTPTGDGSTSTDKPTQTRWSVVHLSAVPGSTQITESTGNADSTDVDQPTVSLQESQIEIDNNQGGTAMANIVVPKGYAGDYQFSVLGAQINNVSPPGVLLHNAQDQWIIQHGGPVTIQLAQCKTPALEFRVIDKTGHWKGITRQVAASTAGNPSAAHGTIPSKNSNARQDGSEGATHASPENPTSGSGQTGRRATPPTSRSSNESPSQESQ